MFQARGLFFSMSQLDGKFVDFVLQHFKYFIFLLDNLPELTIFRVLLCIELELHLCVPELDLGLELLIRDLPGPQRYEFVLNVTLPAMKRCLHVLLC